MYLAAEQQQNILFSENIRNYLLRVSLSQSLELAIAYQMFYWNDENKHKRSILVVTNSSEARNFKM